MYVNLLMLSKQLGPFSIQTYMDLFGSVKGNFGIDHVTA